MLQLTSPAFEHGSSIPARYTCDGQNINPPLEIAHVPMNTLSLALIVEDPDVPKGLRADGMWDHWVIWNIPPSVTIIEENSTPPGVVGTNTNNKRSYGGPCPPDGEHRYFFKLYALDAIVDLPQTARRTDLLNAMEGYVLEQAQLLGTYNRSHQ
ncbi:TPA: YbhB/YbcL family Raf kinase inhibitor-like protein [Candidatus Uhrbacteria bacterium]|nr:YbhB/YbcL family Raf kinase inhibitor-like protein [Candidatus Uhrbacteria bacterium]